MIKRWLRATLPHDAFVLGLMFAYMVVEAAFPLWTRFVLGAPPMDNFMGELLIQIAMILYAAHRVISFHPALNSEYRNWLRTTPWTSRHPLPVGPIHLVAQDVLVLGALAGLAWARHPEISPAHLVLRFLFLYEFLLAFTFCLLHMVWFAYAIAFGLGFIVLAWQAPLLAIAVGAAVYVIGFVGLRRALDNFEAWELDWISEQTTVVLNQEGIDRMRRNVLGWPFDIIRPRDVAASISYRDGLMVSLLAGWWMFVVLQRIDPQARFGGNFVLVFIGQFVIAGRIGTYCWGYAPPISLWGRIFTLRWIIPGYDYVFLAPLITAGIIGAGISVQPLWKAPVEIAAPATLALMFVVTLTSAPTLERWRLTGKHRLSPAVLMANKKAEVTQL